MYHLTHIYLSTWHFIFLLESILNYICILKQIPTFMELHNAQADFLFGFGLCLFNRFCICESEFMENGQSDIGELCFITHCSNIYIVQTSGKFGISCNQGRNVMLPFSRGDSVPLM